MIANQIEEVLDKYVRPTLSEHFGDLKVVTVKDNVVYIRLLGQCANCASAYYTLDELIGKELKKHIPEVKDVVLSTFDEDMLDLAKKILRHEISPAAL